MQWLVGVQTGDCVSYRRRDRTHPDQGACGLDRNGIGDEQTAQFKLVQAADGGVNQKPMRRGHNNVLCGAALTQQSDRGHLAHEQPAQFGQRQRTMLAHQLVVSTDEAATAAALFRSDGPITQEE